MAPQAGGAGAGVLLLLGGIALLLLRRRRQHTAAAAEAHKAAGSDRRTTRGTAEGADGAHSDSSGGGEVENAIAAAAAAAEASAAVATPLRSPGSAAPPLGSPSGDEDEDDDSVSVSASMRKRALSRRSLSTRTLAAFAPEVVRGSQDEEAPSDSFVALNPMARLSGRTAGGHKSARLSGSPGAAISLGGGLFSSGSTGGQRSDLETSLSGAGGFATQAVSSAPDALLLFASPVHAALGTTRRAPDSQQVIKGLR